MALTHLLTLPGKRGRIKISISSLSQTTLSLLPQAETAFGNIQRDAGVRASSHRFQTFHTLTWLWVKPKIAPVSCHDWPDHLALPHSRAAGQRRDGCCL